MSPLRPRVRLLPRYATSATRTRRDCNVTSPLPPYLLGEPDRISRPLRNYPTDRISLLLRSYPTGTRREGRDREDQGSMTSTPTYGQRPHRLPYRTTSIREPRLVSARIRFESVPDRPCAPQNAPCPCRLDAIDRDPTACPEHNRNVTPRQAMHVMDHENFVRPRHKKITQAWTQPHHLPFRPP